MKLSQFISGLDKGAFDSQFSMLYGDTQAPKLRYKEASEQFLKEFSDLGDCEISVFSAPGRTEIGGNHTDHQHGCVLAAAVNLDVIAIVHFHNEPVIRLKSKGYPMSEVGLSDLSVHESEKGTSNALIRGVASKFSEAGVAVSGFDAYTTSNVLSGSGLSSSAAFEILIGTIINIRNNADKATPVDLAKIGQYAENVYYGKKSGLMDQTASAVGGMVFIDFKDTQNPLIMPHSMDLSQYGYDICITDTKGSHADLSDDYSAVPEEMCSVAEQLGCKYLREVDPDSFFNNLAQLRRKCGDRAVLRAMHFFEENQRAFKESVAIEQKEIKYFLELVNESGDSSASLLQNLYSVKYPDRQAIPIALAISKKVLCGKGAVRVHGGGFAGTIQAFVPTEYTNTYKNEMEKLFGKGCCYKLKIRPTGGIKLTEDLL